PAKLWRERMPLPARPPRVSLRGGRASVRRGNRVVRRSARWIAIRPKVAKVSVRSGWRNKDYADLHADYADGSVHRSVGRLGRGSGAFFCGFRALWRSDPRGHHTLHGAAPTFPLRITWGGGQGVRPTRRQADPLSLHRPRAPHRIAGL